MAAGSRHVLVHNPRLGVYRSMTVKNGQAWAALVRAELGRDFDVIFEAFPKSPGRNHLHVEFDPEP